MSDVMQLASSRRWLDNVVRPNVSAKTLALITAAQRSDMRTTAEDLIQFNLAFWRHLFRPKCAIATDQCDADNDIESEKKFRADLASKAIKAGLVFCRPSGDIFTDLDSSVGCDSSKTPEPVAEMVLEFQGMNGDLTKRSDLRDELIKNRTTPAF
jgi:hypothetical protein